MADIGTFTPDQARLLWQDYQERRQLQPHVARNFPRRRPIDEPSPHRVFVRNTTAETIPAYGCVQVISTAIVGGRTVVDVGKPDTLFGHYLFNCQYPIEANENGWAYRFGVVRMLGDAPSEPTYFKAVENSYTIEEGDGPFLVFGPDNVTEGALIGRIDGGARPAYEVTAELVDVLRYTDADGTAELKHSRTNYPHTDNPRGVGEDCNVEFKNPWKLDGLCGSKVILQYVGKRDAADCGEAVAEPAWELTHVENRRARWIKFRFVADSADPIVIESFWDGEDPEECGETVDVEYPLGEPCIDADVVACYDPTAYNYKVIASESAMLGPATTMDIMQAASFDECGINYVKQSAKVFPCGSEPSLIEIAPILVSVDVLTGAGFATTEEPCDTNCLWTWNGTTDTWDQFAACGPNCTCGPAPTLPPGEWNDFGVSYELPCVATITGLQFTKSVIEVCSFMTTGPVIIPTNPCPVPPEPSP